MAEVSRQCILSMLGVEFDNNFIFLPSIGASGGILIAWRARLGMVNSSRVDAFSSSVQFSSSDGTSWWLTCVYGPQGNQEKIQFLQELRDIRYCVYGSMAGGRGFQPDLQRRRQEQ